MLRAVCPRCQHVNSYTTAEFGSRVTCQSGCGKSFTLRASKGGPSRGPRLRPVDANPVSFADLPEGFRFDNRYEIRQRIDRGSFGTVYRAEDLLEHRDVALKIPHDAVQIDEHYMRRFATEVDVLRRMVHPNIVRFYEARLDARPAYLVTEFVEGPNLERILADARHAGGLAPREAASLALKLARALHHAHVKGSVHRDVKPTNVLIDRGEPKLTDFGLARFGNPNLTLQGTRIGTPFYMSPEQVQGDLDAVGPASDQYSLGVVLYQMLCGRVPFEALTAEQVYPRIVAETAPPPSRHHPELPEELERICLRALAKDPMARWTHCGELALELEQWLRASRPASVPPQERSRDTSNPRPAQVAAQVDPRMTRDEAGPIESPPCPAPAAVPPAPTASARQNPRHTLQAIVELGNSLIAPIRPLLDRLGESVNLVLKLLKLRVPAHLDQLTGHLVSRVEDLNRSLREHIPESQAEPSTEADSDGDVEAIAEPESPSSPAPGSRAASIGPIPLDPSLVTRPLDRSSASTAPSAPRPSPATSSPQATGDAAVESYLYFLGEAYTAWVAGDPRRAREHLARCPIRQRGWEWSYLRALTATHFRLLKGGPVEPSAVASDPGGTLVAAIGGDELVLWESGARPRRAPTGGHGGRSAAVAFAPDGSLLAESAGYTVRVRGVDDLRERFTARSQATIKRIAFSSDSSLLAAACGDGRVRIWSVADGAERAPLVCGKGVLHALAFHPDPHSHRLAVASGDGTLSLWDGSAGTAIARTEFSTGLIDVAFHPDGRCLATASKHQTLSFWDTERLDPLSSVQAHESDLVGLGFHPNGRWLVSMGVDRTLRIAETWTDPGDRSRLGREVLTVPLAGSAPSAFAFLADGRRLVLTWPERQTRIWEFPALWASLAAGVPPAFARTIALAPGGRFIAVVGLDGSLSLQAPSGTAPSVPLEPVPGARTTALAFHPSAERLAEALDDGMVRLRDSNTGRVIAQSEVDPGRVNALAFSGDGRRLVTAGASGAIRTWDASTLAPQRTFAGHSPRPATAVSFLEGFGSSRILSGGDDRIVRVWDDAFDGPVTEFKGHERPILAVGGSGDGRRVASVGLDRCLRIWPASGGETLLVLEGVDLLPAVCQAPGSGSLAALGEDHALILDDRI